MAEANTKLADLSCYPWLIFAPSQTHPARLLPYRPWPSLREIKDCWCDFLVQMCTQNTPNSTITVWYHFLMSLISLWFGFLVFNQRIWKETRPRERYFKRIIYSRINENKRSVPNTDLFRPSKSNYGGIHKGAIAEGDCNRRPLLCGGASGAGHTVFLNGPSHFAPSVSLHQVFSCLKRGRPEMESKKRLLLHLCFPCTFLRNKSTR